MQEDNLSEYCFTVEPEEEPQIEGLREINHVIQQGCPSQRRDDGVDHGIVNEPGHPVGCVGHSHHTHTFLGARLLLFNEVEDAVVDGRNVGNEEEEWQYVGHN